MDKLEETILKKGIAKVIFENFLACLTVFQIQFLLLVTFAIMFGRLHLFDTQLSLSLTSNFSSSQWNKVA